MITNINAHGVIELTPENSVEAFALQSLADSKEIMIRYKTKEFTALERLKTYLRKEDSNG